MITSTHHLLTRAWTADVAAVEMAIGRFTSHRLLKNDCDVALFEVPGDGHLHVNVTHRKQTRGAKGWAGPAVLPQGFVHNRTFGKARPDEIVRHIREMVFSSTV